MAIGTYKNVTQETSWPIISAVGRQLLTAVENCIRDTPPMCVECLFFKVPHHWAKPTDAASCLFGMMQHLLVSLTSPPRVSCLPFSLHHRHLCSPNKALTCLTCACESCFFPPGDRTLKQACQEVCLTVLARQAYLWKLGAEHAVRGQAR